ncbi:MAG: hypothetical protein ABGZ53_30685 [Fuerstiella sp.]
MPSITALRGMLNADALRMVRDRFLVGITVYILCVLPVMRGIIQWVTTEVASQWAFDLTPYHPLIVSTLVVQSFPVLPGLIFGLLLLESRENETVKALLVSPNPLSSYIWVTCVVMFVSAALLTVISAAIIALALPPWPALIGVGLAAAPASAIYALLLATVANNKVQAFAYMKLFGIGAWFVIVAWFLPEPWQWLVAIYPPYCASKAYWVAEAGGNAWPLWVLAGLVSSAVWVVVLQRLFLNAARK